MTNHARTLLRTAAPAALVLGLLAASTSLGSASTRRSLAPPSTVPPGAPAPARLVGLYRARFGPGDQQTTGIWHLRVGPGHHLKVWNVDDGVANTPSFEAGPVSFRGNRMVFAKVTAGGICITSSTYRWTFVGRVLSFRLLGKDECGPRPITFTPHGWHRVASRRPRCSRKRPPGVTAGHRADTKGQTPKGI